MEPADRHRRYAMAFLNGAKKQRYNMPLTEAWRRALEAMKALPDLDRTDVIEICIT